MTPKWLKDAWLRYGELILSGNWGRYKIMRVVGLRENQARTLLEFLKTHGLPPKEEVGQKRGIVLSDIHIPFQDSFLLEKVFTLIADISPEYVILNGDILDCYALSFFDKDPNRILSLQDEIEECKDFLQELRMVAGKECKIIFLEGNHCDRLSRNLTKNPQFKSLKCLTWPSLLELDKFDIEFYSYRDVVEIDGVCFTHGHHVRSGAGNTARSHFGEIHQSLVVGHCHRSAHITIRDRTGFYECVENGCLCDLAPLYLGGKISDWVNGFSVVHWFDGGHRIQNVTIKNGKFYFEGKVY